MRKKIIEGRKEELSPSQGRPIKKTGQNDCGATRRKRFPDHKRKRGDKGRKKSVTLVKEVLGE